MEQNHSRVFMVNSKFYCAPCAWIKADHYRERGKDCPIEHLTDEDRFNRPMHCSMDDLCQNVVEVECKNGWGQSTNIKMGFFLQNALDDSGVDYVKNAIRIHGYGHAYVNLWADYYGLRD